MKIEKNIWEIIAWIFIIIGIIAIITGWICVISGIKIFGIDNSFHFYEAISDGIFAIFFFLYSIKNKITSG